MTHAQQQEIAKKAQDLINAIQSCPGTVTLGSTVIEKDARFKKDRFKNKLLLNQMVQNAFHRKYH